MLIELKKIKSDEVGPLLERCLSDYKKFNKLSITKEELDEISENITYESKKLAVDLDVDNYNKIVHSDLSQAKKKSQLCYLLNNEFKEINGYHIPFSVAFSKDVWTYLNLAYFKDMIMDLLFEEDDDPYYKGRIERYYFNMGSNITRTSFRFFWYFGYMLDSDPDRLDVAWEFIDPVKAVFERVLARNPSVFKAFVDGIAINGKDDRFKSNKFRLLIPKNFNSYAAVTLLDCIDYEELVNTVANLQKKLLEM